jgi:tRNA wybutosine-synthesizing protein 1
MDPKLVNLLRKQRYQLIGNHTATKMCTWARKAIKGDGHCYKEKFYGINSHRCIQMTPCADCCTHRCVFCWRAVEFTETQMKDPDDPVVILDHLIEAQKTMLTGYGGVEHDSRKFKEAQDPKHLAISLSGEPTLYPKLGELIALAHKRKMTTFVVTNGTQPEIIESLNPLPTQLYVTLPAPDEQTYKKICFPLKNYWPQILKTISLLQSLKTRTAIRLTLVKGLNLKDPEKYGKIIRIGMPWFVEAKAYMHLGFSTFRLERNRMPDFSEIEPFTRKLADYTGYSFEDASEVSRVALLVRDSEVSKNCLISPIL